MQQVAREESVPMKPMRDHETGKVMAQIFKITKVKRPFESSLTAKKIAEKKIITLSLKKYVLVSFQFYIGS